MADAEFHPSLGTRMMDRSSTSSRPSSKVSNHHIPSPNQRDSPKFSLDDRKEKLAMTTSTSIIPPTSRPVKKAKEIRDTSLPNFIFQFGLSNARLLVRLQGLGSMHFRAAPTSKSSAHWPGICSVDGAQRFLSCSRSCDRAVSPGGLA